MTLREIGAGYQAQLELLMAGNLLDMDIWSLITVAMLAFGAIIWALVWFMSLEGPTEPWLPYRGVPYSEVYGTEPEPVRRMGAILASVVAITLGAGLVTILCAALFMM